MNKKIYVFPHCKKEESEISKIQGISRLFAYPGKPHFCNNGEITILDSGAFGLSQYGGKITYNYMQRLSKHYEEYAKEENVLCVAPDEFLNPMQSMWNLRKWFKYGFYTKNIAAIIQAERKEYIDMNNLKFQVDYYSNFTDIMFFSNNGLTGEMAKMFKLEELFRYMKEIHKVKWIHILGAGWNIKDIKDWCSINYFDSLDSIAYYNVENEFGSIGPIENINTIIQLIREVNSNAS